MSPKEQRHSEWAARISEFKASGLKMTHWCKAQDIDLEQMKYWTRKFKKIATVQPSSPKAFIPLTTTEAPISNPPSSLVIQVGSARIELHRGFDTELLCQAVKALSSSC